MEYHYSENDLATDPTMSGYAEEFSPQYLIPTKEADYELRSSMLVDGGDRFGVSSAVFDKYEELIWMGNQGGHVTSYYGPTMQKYTSFQVHETDEIRDIVTHEQALFILTKSQLRQQIRRGLPKHTYKSENMVEMQCLYQESPTKLLMGGHQNKLLELDITKMTETVIPIDEKGCAVLRSSGGSLVACGSACGTVSLRDVRTPNMAEHTFKAHSACLSDLDMQGDLLITCGFAHSNEETVAESYVIVWDVRYLRNKGKEDNVRVIPTVSPPLLLHFLPAFSGRAVVCAGDGHVALLHLNSTSEKQAVFQVDTHSTACTVMDVAATSQALVFGDQSGHLNLFSPQHNNEPRFNQFSRETEFATPTNLPSVSFNSPSFRYSSLPAPTLTTGTRWANEMPINFYRNVYRKPKPIDPEVLRTMKMQGPIGYAPNPKTCRRNEMPYVEDRLEDLQAMRQNRNATQPIPQRYIKMDIRFNRCGPNNAILGTINLTRMPGIEATLPNSYCNAMLQVLYYIAPLKATLLAHTCAKEFCLSCELGFLFRMLDTSDGTPCQASNFLRAFRTVPEAAALGLILPDRGPEHRVDLVALIQSWNRFILHQIHYEILETRRKELELQILANSPPKGRTSLKNGPIPMPPMNGHYDKYQFTEIEFLGPTQFEEELREDPWLTGREEGICESEPINPKQNSTPTPNENHEIASKKSAKEESEISQLFAIGRHQLNRCLKCNKEEGRESVVLACALQYPSVASRETEQRSSFIELIRASLSSRRSTPAWCEQCGKFTPTSQRGRLIRLPPILAINCGGVNVREKAYWAKGSQKEMVITHIRNLKSVQSGRILSCRPFVAHILNAIFSWIPLSELDYGTTGLIEMGPHGKRQLSNKKESSKSIHPVKSYEPEVKRGASSKPCRYGLHCARPGCHFKHPESPNASQSSSLKSPTHESNCVLPLQLLIRLQADGDVIVNDKQHYDTSSEPNSPNHRVDSKFKRKVITTATNEEYSLTAAVVCVEDNPKNLVAFIQTDGRDSDWYMFNDLSAPGPYDFDAHFPLTPEVQYSYIS